MTEETLKRYGKRIGPKLKALMEHFHKSGNHLDVREELALIRAVHSTRLALFDSVLETTFPATVEGAQQQKEATEIAGSIAMQSAESVIAMCEKVAKIDTLAAAQNSPFALDSVKAQICQFVYRVFDSPDLPADATEEEKIEYARKKAQIKLFETAMDNELELPTLGAKPTTITPDQQVRAMDDTIPFCE